MDRLKEKVAIVTGGASGVGRAGSVLFARNACKVVVADINREKGDAVVQSIRREGGTAHFVPVDVGDSKQVQAMVSEAEREFGGIDILFTNAANVELINKKDRCAPDLEESVFDEMVRVILRGTFLCAKYAARAMIRRGGGSMVFTATVDAQIGTANLDAYTAAKGGVIAMTRSMAAGLAERNIRVNAISPGFINTEAQADWMSNEHSRRQIESLHLLPIPDPEQVVPLALFLASEDAGSITGSIHQVDAGYMAFKSRQIDVMAALNPSQE